MAEDYIPATVEIKAPRQNGKNPFASGFVPNGRRKKKSQSYLTKRNLLKYMLEVDLSVQDLPQKMADDLRTLLPGWFESVERRFTMRQIMELVQFQLLFSKSDYVRQDAINAIKDRVDGKAVQKLTFDPTEVEETEIILPNGRKIAI